jgi:hypothetical protein
MWINSPVGADDKILLSDLRALLHRTHRKAFTALEVMLVVTLVFVVAVIGFPSVQEAKPRSSIQLAQSSIENNSQLWYNADRMAGWSDQYGNKGD